MKPRMGVIFYNYEINDDKVYIGDYPNGDNADATYPYTFLKRFINAKGAGGGTGTVLGLGEAYDYFSQTDTFNYYGGFDHRIGTYKDPLYRCEADRTNCSAPGWCHKNYVILISDGQWNNPSCTYADDPVQPARRMHIEKLRTISGHSINVDKVYTLGVFMGGTGVTSMKNVAMYGSFDLATGLDWPGGTTGYPTDSCDVDDCSGDGSGSSCVEVPYPSHSDWDEDGDGLPDTFFAPQNALDLKRSLFSIFQDIISDVGASASVATVTQDVLGEDVVIRGAFRNNPLDNKIWEGHFESYWPVSECIGAQSEDDCPAPCTWDANTSECKPYTFQNEQNIANHSFCSDIDFQGKEYCWDVHEKLADQDDRNIFTYINGIKVGITEENANLLHSYLENELDFNGDGAVDIEDTKQLIRWINGEWDDSWSNDIRYRSGLLGDIVYSAPVVVGEPSLGSVPKNIAAESCKSIEPCFAHTDADSCSEDTSNRCQWDWSDGLCKAPYCNEFSDNQTSCIRQPTCTWNASGGVDGNGICEEKSSDAICQLDGADACFYTYRTCNAHRKKIAYVGANDGMLHAFVVGVWDAQNEQWIYDDTENSEIGIELWAYIPSNLLSEMRCLASDSYGKPGGCQHRTTVDLSNLVWDVTLDTSTGECSGSPSSNCTSYSSDQSGCESAGCTWNCSGEANCTDINDSSLCDLQSGCEWQCSGSFDCSDLTQADCQNANGCSWGCEEGTDSCSSFDNYSDCSNNSNCNWDCVGSYKCEDIADSTDCLDAGCSLSGCYWEGKCKGDYDCNALDKDACTSSSILCEWEIDAECQGTVECSNINSRWKCRNRGCTWTGNRRSGSCSGSPSCGGFDKWICNDTEGCSWNTISEGCENKSNCTDLPRRRLCNQYTGSCTGGNKDCSDLSGSAICSDMPGCSGSCNGECCTGTGTCNNDNCFSECDSGCVPVNGGSATCSVDYCPAGCETSCTGTIQCSDITSQTACTASGCEWTAGTSSPWRTVIVGGERGGGDLYFAIDVTEPDSPSILWEYSVLRNMVNLQKTDTNTYTALRPYAKKTIYDDIKTYPLSWAVPYIGRLVLPEGLELKAEKTILYPWSPDPTPASGSTDPATGLSPVTWGDSDHQLSGWVAFIGGGMRVYDPEDLLAPCSDYTLQSDCTADARCSWDSSKCDFKEGDDVRKQMFEPYLLALDIKSGINIFQYTWPVIQRAFSTQWQPENVDDKLIPHSMNTAIALDLWKGIPVKDDDSNIIPEFGKDGLIDHIFLGDTAGTFWGLRFENSKDSNSAPVKARIVADMWKTKMAVSDCASLTSEGDCTANGCWWDSTTTSCEDGYGTRGARQPITATPSAAFDFNKNLRLYFGTGQFENARGTFNDQNDKGHNSFYNLTLPLGMYTSDEDDNSCSVLSSTLPSVTIACAGNMVKVSADDSTTSDDINIRIRPHDCASLCSGTSDDWVTPPNPDTARAAFVDSSCAEDKTCVCSKPCYSCILDLPGAGERIFSQALVAGGLVFFTTFQPNTEVCGGGGNGYLYVVDFMCRKLSKNPFGGSGLAAEWLTSSGWTEGAASGSAVRANLGSGMPSRPVLDSTGEHVLIQTSDARIHRIKIDLPYMDFLKGWKIRGQD